MLPESFQEHEIRVYFRKSDPKSLEKAKRLVNTLLLQTCQVLQTFQVSLCCVAILITAANQQEMLCLRRHAKNCCVTTQITTATMSSESDGQVYLVIMKCLF